MYSRLLLCLLGVAAFDLQSQTEPLRFDVASVKIDHSGTGGSGDRFPKNGAWKWTRIPLSFLVSYAYDVSLKQVDGIPESFQGLQTAFNITAKMPADVTHEAFGKMLQSLLAERFQMVVHRETRDIPVNTIEVSKGGAKLKPATGECASADPVPPGQRRCGELLVLPSITNQVLTYVYVGRSVSMAELVRKLSSNGPLVDDTGIKGLFDLDVKFDMELTPDASPAEREFAYQDVFRDAFEKQAGLRIELGKLKKRPITVMVVDHVEMPTPN
jgi:uncharacterized protein (TIGR03435 family)